MTDDLINTLVDFRFVRTIAKDSRENSGAYSDGKSWSRLPHRTYNSNCVRRTPPRGTQFAVKWISWACSARHLYATGALRNPNASHHEG